MTDTSNDSWNRVFCIRHGENLANLTLEFSHRKVDYPLTPKGVLQAGQTAQWFRNQGVQELYSSPLLRAQQTAQVIGDVVNLPVTVVEAFREVNVGDLEGQKPTAEVWKQHNAIIAEWLNGQHDACFPGGEDFHHLLARSISGFQSVLRGKAGRTIAIVAHGGIFSFTLAHICANYNPALSTNMGNCAIAETRARMVGDTLEMEILRYPDTSHLSGEASKLVLGYIE